MKLIVLRPDEEMDKNTLAKAKAILIRVPLWDVRNKDVERRI